MPGILFPFQYISSTCDDFSCLCSPRCFLMLASAGRSANVRFTHAAACTAMHRVMYHDTLT
jgi:hypothetical protein